MRHTKEQEKCDSYGGKEACCKTVPEEAQMLDFIGRDYIIYFRYIDRTKRKRDHKA